MLEWLISYRADAQHIGSLILGLAMWRLGGGPERAAGAAFIGLLIVPAMTARLTGFSLVMFGDLAWTYVLLDIAAAGAFVVIALNANRGYLLWIAGFQLVAVSAHVVRMVIDTVSPIAYVILAVGPSYSQLLLLWAGLISHRQRLRRHGPYRDWRPSLPGGGWLGLSQPRRFPDG